MPVSAELIKDMEAKADKGKRAQSDPEKPIVWEEMHLLIGYVGKDPFPSYPNFYDHQRLDYLDLGIQGRCFSCLPTLRVGRQATTSYRNEAGQNHTSEATNKVSCLPTNATIMILSFKTHPPATLPGR